MGDSLTLNIGVPGESREQIPLRAIPSPSATF